MAAKTRRATPELMAAAGGCTEVARRTGRPCLQKPQPYTDRCRSHPRPPRTAVTAASARMSISGVGWKTWKFGDQAWQLEAWRMYDIVGELRKYANWIGAAVSRCRLYVAEVDENGEPTQEVEDPEIAALAAGPLGRGPAKDEALRLLGVNLAVVGEAYIVAEAAGNLGMEMAEQNSSRSQLKKAASKTPDKRKKNADSEDRWYVVSGSEITQQGQRLMITRPALFNMGGELEFREGIDLLIRCWTPHPRRTMWADSSVRAAIPVLRKIETTMKRSFAELDSRLTGAGALVLPHNVDFPRGDGVPEGIDGLAQTFMNIASISIEDRASSEAMVPLILTVPPDTVDKIKFITFWSELSEHIQAMEDASIRRLAVELDLPPEVLMGIGSSNHWNAWAVEESTIKIFIEPVLARIAEALDHGYLDAALEQMGLDPDRYTYAFDTAALAVRPDRSSDALNFNAVGLVSDEATRRAGNYTDEDAPDSVERVRHLLEKILPAKPELLADPIVQKLLGLEKELAGMNPAAPPSQPALEQTTPAEGIQPPPEIAPRGLPQSNPARGQATAPEATASIYAVSNYAVMHALGLAGSRLIPHRQRDRWPGAPKHELHVRHGAVSRERAQEVLRGAWDNLLAAADHDEVLVDVNQVRQLLDEFCVELLTRGMAYHPQMLRDLISTAARRLAAPMKVGAGV